MSKGYEQRKEANKRYLAKQDELKIRIPGGQKQAVEAHAAIRGKSINALVNDLLREDMGLTEAQWKGKEQQSAWGADPDWVTGGFAEQPATRRKQNVDDDDLPDWLK